MNESAFEALHRASERFPKYRDRLPFLPRATSRTILMRTNAFEIIATQWAPGSKTPVHDHGTSQCWVLVVEGELHVENFKRLDDGDAPTLKLRPEFAQVLSLGDSSRLLGPRQLHRVRNTSVEPAFTIQLYMPPISAYTVLEDKTRYASLCAPDYHATLDLQSVV